ncbi:unnamed protein product, partial [marine sediment metagenome]
MKQYTWTPWYHGLYPDSHYRARMPGTKIEECLPWNVTQNAHFVTG